MSTSPLREAMRKRLTLAIRERDRMTSSVLRSTIAALENAEAVSTSGDLAATTSSRIAGAAIGVGAAEAERRVLDLDAEADIVRAELEGLRDAAATYEEHGEAERAAAARHAAGELTAVVHSVLGTTWG